MAWECVFNEDPGYARTDQNTRTVALIAAGETEGKYHRDNTRRDVSSLPKVKSNAMSTRAACFGTWQHVFVANPHWCKSKIGRSHREIIVRHVATMVRDGIATEFGLPISPDAS
jgi:hypothetical protein